jgi:hypothetical protein
MPGSGANPPGEADGEWHLGLLIVENGRTAAAAYAQAVRWTKQRNDGVRIPVRSNPSRAPSCGGVVTPSGRNRQHVANASLEIPLRQSRMESACAAHGLRSRMDFATDSVKVKHIGPGRWISGTSPDFLTLTRPFPFAALSRCLATNCMSLAGSRSAVFCSWLRSRS